jgi:hypothetical protein
LHAHPFAHALKKPSLSFTASTSNAPAERDTPAHKPPPSVTTTTNQRPMADGQARPSSSKAPPPPPAAPPPSALEQERNRLANALAQLERSNAELRRELDAARDGGRPPDRDYKEALQDNLVVVARYRARVAALDEEIEKVTRGAAAAAGGGGAFGPPRDAGGVGVGMAPEAAAAGAARGAAGAAAAGSGGGGAAAMATDENDSNANANGGGGEGGDGMWV